MKLFYLLNPTRVKNRWDWREVAARHAKRTGWTPRFGEVDRNLPHSTERLLGQALEEGCTRIVVIGGDGSLHRTINELSHRKRLPFTEVAVVPAGTCNDFSRHLSLSRKKIEDAFRLACTGKSKSSDLGLMDKELFLNNAGFGRRPDPPGTRRRALATLGGFRPVQLKATWDKGSIEGAFFMGIICNAPFFSGGLHFSKLVNVQDGLLDVYMIPVMPKWKLLSFLALGRFGRPVRFQQLFTVRASRLTLETESDIWPQSDGEPPLSARRRVSFSSRTKKL